MASEFVRDGFYDDYPDTPRFKYGGGQVRLIYDRKQMEKEKRSTRRENTAEDQQQRERKTRGKCQSLFNRLENEKERRP